MTNSLSKLISVAVALLPSSIKLYLTLGIDDDEPLPPPKKAADSLKNAAFQALKKWHEAYSSGYRKLELAYNYLRTCHQVDFARSDHMSALQRHQEREIQLQIEAQHQKKISNITTEINGNRLVLSSCYFVLFLCR